ncbi:MAG: hypothetical protein ACYTGF_09140, partial [Planctomycetota bacterium]
PSACRRRPGRPRQARNGPVKACPEAPPGRPPKSNDLSADDIVGVTDFLDLLAVWGTDPGGPPDFDGDGNVGVMDFLELLAAWGPCP